MKGLDLLQQHLDAGTVPADWPEDVCRDAWCGNWERCDGYVWHRPGEHLEAVATNYERTRESR